MSMFDVKEPKVNSHVSNNIFDPMSIEGHEQVVFCYDETTGLKAIIAIHNTVLGPSLGGTRMWNYSSESDALNDVLRLSKGMTYKAAISGLNLGGGKAVIIGNSKRDKSEALFRKFGRFVNNLNGKYITAEDVGTSTKDMEYVKLETNYVSGLPVSMGGGGDPSPVTAYGTYMGMKASAKEMWGNDSLAGKKVSVQGVGHVGQHLVKLLSEEKAKIFVSDLHEEPLRLMAVEYGAEVVPAEIIYDLDVDIYAPCALGATINDETIDRMKCSIIAGAANNQLSDEEAHGEMLLKKGILYAPDFLINAGGLINVSSELNGYNRQRAMRATEKIYDVTLEIFATAKQQNITTQKAAMRIAEKRIVDIGKLKSTF
jgi:leucine dehydrogenase